MKFNRLIVLAAILTVLATAATAAMPASRVKDLASVLGARENQLLGFGLVVGLNNTGDKTQTGFTQQALTNLLSRMGVVPQVVDFKSRNVAAVMVTATLPPFTPAGQKLDVTVSSVGDATSLQGGTLLMTPLQGADDQVYAVAQGSLVVGVDPASPSVPYARQRQVTVGRIPSGALVEKEVPVTLAGKAGLSIVLNEPDFTTANRLVSAIRTAGFDATARDAGTITVPLSGEDIVTMIARIENLKITPDTVAKIVINERTGTVVIGENVVLAPVAVSYGGIDVYIGGIDLYSEGTNSENIEGETRYTAQGKARMKKKETKLTLVPAAPTLATLVRALNTIGLSNKDLIAILQAMKKAGAIKAELEVI
ncbi:MAG: flagellar basal body P-ring protein FlgI [Candidatus Margulisbacteria bacterium]|nr:flagellar basal body P-ring protein FlgI [Candidatus Margulisiibacteriota bacterium]